MHAHEHAHVFVAAVWRACAVLGGLPLRRLGTGVLKLVSMVHVYGRRSAECQCSPRGRVLPSD